MNVNIDTDPIDELSNHSPWITMDNIDWSDLTRNLKPICHLKDEVIYSQLDSPNYVYLVKSGRVRLSLYSLNGKEKSLFIAAPGSIFGELSAIDSYSNSANAIANTETYLYHIPKHIFTQALSDNHVLSLNVLQLMTKKMRLLTTQIKQLAFNDSYYRVCYALTHLINQYGIQNGDVYQLSIKFTHQEMGDLAGLSRVAVSNILSNMANEGILKKIDGYLIIKNMASIHDYLLEHI